MKDAENLADQLSNCSETEKLMFHFAKVRASETTNRIQTLKREKFLLEEQLASYVRMLWQGLSVALITALLFWFFEASPMQNVWSLLWVLALPVSSTGIAVLVIQQINQIALVKARLEDTKRLQHYSGHHDDEDDLKVDLKLLSHVRTWVSWTSS